MPSKITSTLLRFCETERKPKVMPPDLNYTLTTPWTPPSSFPTSLHQKLVLRYNASFPWLTRTRHLKLRSVGAGFLHPEILWNPLGRYIKKFRACLKSYSTIKVRPQRLSREIDAHLVFRKGDCKSPSWHFCPSDFFPGIYDHNWSLIFHPRPII